MKLFLLMVKVSWNKISNQLRAVQAVKSSGYDDIHQEYPSFSNKSISSLLHTTYSDEGSWGPEVPPSAYTQVRSRKILAEEEYEEEAHFTCYNTDTNIQRTHTRAVVKGEALEWAWCPEQAL